MVRYLIDTNILSYLIDTASPFHEAACVHLATLTGRRMRSAGDQRGHEVVVPGGGFAFALEARLQCGVGASKVERDFAEQGQVPGCGALAYAACIFVEPDVEYPMQPVLDRPMASDGGGELCRR